MGSTISLAIVGKDSLDQIVKLGHHLAAPIPVQMVGYVSVMSQLLTPACVQVGLLEEDVKLSLTGVTNHHVKMEASAFNLEKSSSVPAKKDGLGKFVTSGRFLVKQLQFSKEYQSISFVKIMAHALIQRPATDVCANQGLKEATAKPALTSAFPIHAEMEPHAKILSIPTHVLAQMGFKERTVNSTSMNVTQTHAAMGEPALTL